MRVISKLSNGYNLVAIEYGERSPMEDHNTALEIAVDDVRKRFYAHALLLHTYGLDSVQASCERYRRST